MVMSLLSDLHEGAVFMSTRYKISMAYGNQMNMLQNLHECAVFMNTRYKLSIAYGNKLATRFACRCSMYEYSLSNELFASKNNVGG